MNFIENFNDGLIKGITKKIDVTKKAVDDSIDETANNIQNNLTSVLGPDKESGLLDPLNRLLFTLLIKPFNKNAVLKHSDNGTLKIIGMSIILLITTTFNNISTFIMSFLTNTYDYTVGNTLSTNDYIVENSVGKVISFGEKAVGYRTDGRTIENESKQSAKIPLLLKILKTFLGVLAGLLDIVLMAFTNQVDVFSTIVKDLLGK